MTSARRAPGSVLLGLCVATTVALHGCGASAPWACTPDACVSFATEDLPQEVRGRWQAEDGAVLQVFSLSGSRTGPVIQTTALLEWTPPQTVLGLTHLASFDGQTILAEQRVGEGSMSPRRFHRLVVQDNRLHIAPLRIDALLEVSEGDNVRIVQAADGDAVEYFELQDMAITMTGLLDRPEAWGAEKVYGRMGG